MFHKLFNSTKNKKFYKSDQIKIDKICRKLNKFTKKKFEIEFDIREVESFGAHYQPQKYDVYSEGDYGGRYLDTQLMTYNYCFESKTYQIEIVKMHSLNKKTTEALLKNCQFDLPNNHNYRFSLAWNMVPGSTYQEEYDALIKNNIEVVSIRPTFKYNKKNQKTINPQWHSRANILITNNNRYLEMLENYINHLFKEIAKTA